MRRLCLIVLLVLTLPTSSWAAIALDAATDCGNGTGTSYTSGAHTVGAGSNRILFIGVMTLADVLTGATWNGVAMTQVAKVAESGGGTWEHIYVLVNPASGAQNIVVSASASTTIWILAASYTDAKQSGQPDSFNTGTAASATSLTLSTTVVASNSWLVGFFRGSNAAPSAGTGTTSRVANGNGIMFGDSNGTVSTGSQSLQGTTPGAGTWGGVIASFDPPGAGGATPRGMLLGVLP